MALLDGPAWVRLRADDYEAVVSAASVSGSPLLSDLLDVGDACASFASAAATTAMRTLRLDCSARVGREVVAALRLGASYASPTGGGSGGGGGGGGGGGYDDGGELRRMLDLLGLDAAVARLDGSGSGRHHAAAVDRPLLLVPSYVPAAATSSCSGVCAWSGDVRGWAVFSGSRDPRPGWLRSVATPPAASDYSEWGSSATPPCLAAVLRREDTGSSCDLLAMLPTAAGAATTSDAPADLDDGLGGGLGDGGGGALIRLQLGEPSSVALPAPPLGRCQPGDGGMMNGAAMASARGRLFVLGGGGGGSDATAMWPLAAAAATGGRTNGRGRGGATATAAAPFNVFDPSLGCWFATAGAPPVATADGGGGSGGGHYCLVANAAEGLLLAFGGRCPARLRRSGEIAVFDIAAGRWSRAPPGSEFVPFRSGSANHATDVRAAPLDEWSVLALSSSPQSAQQCHVLDLRAWRWRAASAPAAADDSDSNFEPSSRAGSPTTAALVRHAGRVVALGGGAAVREYDAAGDAWAELPPLPCALRAAAAAVSARVISS